MKDDIDLKTFKAKMVFSMLAFGRWYGERAAENPGAHPKKMTEQDWRAALCYYLIGGNGEDDTLPF